MKKKSDPAQGTSWKEQFRERFPVKPSLEDPEKLVIYLREEFGLIEAEIGEDDYLSGSCPFCYNRSLLTQSLHPPDTNEHAPYRNHLRKKQRERMIKI